ncbi:MAG: hypothetical protein A2542_02265 [Parcubacteria group bacterium RIFOXYD2_FULL_52_8]|nr:MAG: hypothetical protein A2542_02265 [Parcubacteria group bacterium RIFOXYD2_FULL_52_8]
MFPTNIDIGKIKTLSELAPILSVSESQLRYFLESKESLIKRGLILKRSGTFRRIMMAKDDSFRHFLLKLSSLFYSKYELHIPAAVHGFVRGRSIVTNAQQHTQKKIVLNVDIENFFDSISFEQVVALLISFGFQENIAKVLAELTTVNGILATGFSTSPVLSNMACIVMDGVFKSWSKKRNFTYTRYADDLTFSSEQYVPAQKEIAEILGHFGFKINLDKYRVYRRGGPQYVTGLTVVDKRPRLGRKRKRSMRLELYYIKKHGFLNHFYHALDRATKRHELPSKFTRTVFFGYGVDGFRAFMHSIEPRLACNMQQVLKKEAPKARN